MNDIVAAAGRIVVFARLALFVAGSLRRQPSAKYGTAPTHAHIGATLFHGHRLEFVPDASPVVVKHDGGLMAERNSLGMRTGRWL